MNGVYNAMIKWPRTMWQGVCQGAKGTFAPTYDPVKGEGPYKVEDYSATRTVEEYIGRQEGVSGFFISRLAAGVSAGTAFWDAGVHSVQGLAQMGQGELGKGAFRVARAIRFTILAPFALVGLLIPGAVKVIDENLLGASALQGDYRVKGVLPKIAIHTKRIGKGVKRAYQKSEDMGKAAVKNVKKNPTATGIGSALLAFSVIGLGVYKFYPSTPDDSDPVPPTPNHYITPGIVTGLGVLTAACIHVYYVKYCFGEKESEFDKNREQTEPIKGFDGFTRGKESGTIYYHGKEVLWHKVNGK